MMANLFCFNYIDDYWIVSNVCACHTSTAIMPCAKFHWDHVIRLWIKAKWNYCKISIVAERSLVKWATSFNGIPGVMLLNKTIFFHYVKFSIFENHIWIWQVLPQLCCNETWDLSQYKDHLSPSMGIPMLKVRQSWDCLIFNMGSLYW